MSPRNLTLWLGLPVVIIIAWLLAVYGPMDRDMKKKEAELSTIRSERQKLEGSIRNMSTEMGVQESLRKSYDAFMGQAPVIQNMPGYLRDVVRLAQSKGVTVRNLHGNYASLDLSGTTGLVNPIFEVSVLGGFLETGRFLEDLSNKAGFKGIRRATMSYDQKDYPALTGTVVIEFKALKGHRRESK